MGDLPRDVFTEPVPDPNTLEQLGPLRALAGTWLGERGIDTHPTANGPEDNVYVERIDLQPIDAQTNGPQLFYGLRYHVHITKPGEVQTFHDQVGYWLWEPATGMILMTLAIPRGQVAMAQGKAHPDDLSFTVEAVRGSLTNGIISNSFLEYGFRTERFAMTVTAHSNGTWSYKQDTVMKVVGQEQPFHHTDRNILTRIAPPTPNPTSAG
ncbi:MAG TPA: heme-binding beta-barrel domain-containing protein [Kofleriaceae bacterium]